MLEQQQMDLAGPEFQSELDVSSLLKLSAAGDHMKDDREGEEQSDLNMVVLCLLCSCVQQ